MRQKNHRNEYEPEGPQSTRIGSDIMTLSQSQKSVLFPNIQVKNHQFNQPLKPKNVS
jgi:hypothetical protein